MSNLEPKNREEAFAFQLWAFYSGDPDEFYKLFDLFKSKKLSFSEDAPMAILESGWLTTSPTTTII